MKVSESQMETRFFDYLCDFICGLWYYNGGTEKGDWMSCMRVLG